MARFYRAHRTAIQTTIAALLASAFVWYFLADQLG